MDPLAEIRETFFQECEEQLAALEEGLVEMESGDASAEVLNAVFRAVHSIKGGAGAFKLTNLVGFSHTFETALDRIRSGKMDTSPSVLRLLLKSSDELSDLVQAAREGNDEPDDAAAQLTAELESLVASSVSEDGEGLSEFSDLVFHPVGIEVPLISAEMNADVAKNTYSIHFKPHSTLYKNANEPIALLRCVSRLGSIQTTCDTSGVPPLGELDPQESYLGFQSRLECDCSEAEVKEIFEFVEGYCELSVEQADAAQDHQAELEELLLKVKSADQSITELTPDKNLEKKDETRQPGTSSNHPSSPTIRVELDRVDRLINVVGELVINQAMLTQSFRQSDRGVNPEVSLNLTEMAQLTREIQDSVMAIRAQPLKPMFQRMGRTIREVAESTGKKVRLQTAGEATEVDKTVIELLSDPLTHMIRNAVDHGVESPEVRLAKGKSEEGVIHLSAAHRSGRVIIEVSDDGAGINRPRVLASAISKGLIAEDAQLSESEIDNLLFLPGFSTATTVSNISGRGVGMDVVKRSIQALGGRITIASKPDSGSVFTLSLPLTLAVQDGIVVSIDDQTFIIPLTAIVETLKPETSDYFALGANSFVIKVREDFVPLVDVGVELGIRSPSIQPRTGVAILIETESRNLCALLVDRILDQRQVVIKGLETNYQHVDGIAAATILGDGRVALILDVEGIVKDHVLRSVPTQTPFAKAS